MNRYIEQFVGAALLAGLFAISGCEKSDASAPAGAAQPPPMVGVKSAVARDVPVYLDEIGRCVAVEMVSIEPQVGGRINDVHFREGMDVKKGDLLFTIDPRPFKAALDQAEASVQQMRETLNLAHIEFSRVDGLQGTNAVSQSEYDQKKSTVAIDEAQVKVGEASVETAKLNLEYCTITSPIDGRTGLVLIDPGNVVKGNEGSLVTVQKIDPIEVDFTVTERQLSDVRKHMAAGELRVEASLPGSGVNEAVAAAAVAQGQPPATMPTTSPADDSVRVGTLVFLDNAVQDVTGTVKLRASIKNTDRHFWPGQFVNVRLILETKKDAVLIPANAIQIGQEGTFVYVVKPDSSAEMRPLGQGQKQGNEVVINSGLAAGERVVVTGQMMVQPGGKVTVLPDAPPQQAMAAAPTSAPAQ